MRTVVDRLAGNGDHTISAEMRDVETVGRHLIEVRADTDEVTKVHLDIRFKRIRVLPPIGKKKRYPALDLTVIHAVEPNPPAGRKRIEWKLLTDLEVHSCEEAVEKSNGTRCAGRLRSSIRSSSPVAGLKMQDYERPIDWQTSSPCFAS
ncbi:hypothetical protein ACOJBO_02685 [Rhizobium beringeri]